MGRSKTKPVAAKLVTTYTDRVELVKGDEPLRLGDLEALVGAAKDAWLNDELAEVTLSDGMRDPYTGLIYNPRTITVTSTSKSEENL